MKQEFITKVEELTLKLIRGGLDEEINNLRIS